MNETFAWRWLGRMNFQEALALQEELVAKKRENRNAADEFLLLEHEPVYTIGRTPDQSSLVFIVVNLDPHHMQHGWVQAPLDSLPSPGPGGDGAFIAYDLLDDVQYTWRGEWNYVRFDPGMRQGHIFRLKPLPMQA